jgi:hypothetical protein
MAGLAGKTKGVLALEGALTSPLACAPARSLASAPAGVVMLIVVFFIVMLSILHVHGLNNKGQNLECFK